MKVLAKNLGQFLNNLSQMFFELFRIGRSYGYRNTDDRGEASGIIINKSPKFSKYRSYNLQKMECQQP
jgi:hypothetical protein